MLYNTLIFFITSDFMTDLVKNINFFLSRYLHPVKFNTPKLSVSNVMN